MLAECPSLARDDVHQHHDKQKLAYDQDPDNLAMILCTKSAAVHDV